MSDRPNCTLFLNPLDYDTIAGRAATDYPNESCGVILGRVTGDRYYATRTLPVPNVHPNPTHFYTMDPPTQLEVYQLADQLQLHPLCVWHTHTTASSTTYPSAADIDNAHDPRVLQLILRIQDGTLTGQDLWQVNRHADPPVTPARLELLP
jgi:proteasome lid subunit RPN8/RPN11